MIGAPRATLVVFFLTGLYACATNTPNLPRLNCPEPLTLPTFTEDQLAELESLSRETQLILMERDALQTKRRAMLQQKCKLFTE